MTLFRNGRYSVEVASDGAIRVKPGDWISKYSAAIHNDFTHIHEYGRRGPQGEIIPVADPDRIRAGETLYHLPTRAKAQKPAPASLRTAPAASRTASARPLSRLQQKEVVKRILEQEFDLRGDRARVLSRAIDIVGYTDNAATLLEIAGLLGRSALATAGAEALAIGSIVLFPVGAIISLINAAETGERMYGMRAIAYTTTAWAFGDAIPDKSSRIIENVKAGPHTPDTLRSYHKAWSEASKSAVRELEDTVRKLKTRSNSYQILLRALGEDNRQKLCRTLLDGFTPQLRGTALKVWNSNLSILYPT